MNSVNPIYFVALVVAILIVIYVKLSNPYRDFSTSSYWKSATLESISEIPQEALMPGNRNGPVIMWAAIGSVNPDVLSVLQDAGADINESDGIFKGTPLTGAAGYTENPEMINELVRLGADINKLVHNNETALMIAAQYNKTPLVTTTLVNLGAKLEKINSNGKTALDLAIGNKNKVAIEELKQLSSQ